MPLDKWDETLFKVENAEDHDPRYFAMLHDAVAISDDSTFEGGQTKEALAYYQYLLKLKLPNCPIQLKLTSKQSQALDQGISNLIQFNTLLEESFADGTINTEKGLDKIISQIKTYTDKTSACYLPSGYRNENTAANHFAGLKVEKLGNGNFVFSAINQGDGMRYHRIVETKGRKKKLSYQSDEFEIDLKSDNGREFLQRMLQICFDTQKKHDTKNLINTYSADDLYGLLQLYGKKIYTPNKIKQKGVTEQRTGTCTVTNTHGVARDILIDQDADFETRKRYHFTLKLHSLIAGFDAYLKGKYPHNILAWALTEFSTRLNKQYRNILTDEEMIYCSQLQAQIQQRLAEDKKVELQKKCNVSPWPQSKGTAPKYQQNIFDPEKIKTSEKTDNLRYIKYDLSVETKKAIKPQDIKDLLKYKYNDPSEFKKIYDILNSLPHCTGLDEDPFWDKVPESDIEDIFSNLYNIIKELPSSPDQSALIRARKFAIALRLYDIAAQLAPRYKKNNGFKLGYSYALALDDVYSEHYFYTDPIAYYTIKRVVKNFEQRAKNKKRIFSNAVHPDDYYKNDHINDHTIQYVMDELLTYEKRTAVGQAVCQEKRQTSCSNLEAFEYLIKHLDMAYYGDNRTRLRVLDPNVEKMIGIAATANALGKFTKTYDKNEVTGFWSFSQNRFFQEVERQKELRKFTGEIVRHLPSSITQKNSQGQYQDFSENTIYHPHDNLKNQQKELKTSWGEYSPLVKLQPYQIYLSGSLNPSSTIWEANSKQQMLYEELNEELRHIECSPHLQIQRSLTWATANLDKLHNKNIRLRIHELLFHYGKLEYAFVNQLEPTLLNLEDFLTALITYCENDAPQDTELLLWASQLAYDLRYHVEVTAKIHSLPIQDFSLPSFQRALLMQIKTRQTPICDHA